MKAMITRFIWMKRLGAGIALLASVLDFALVVAVPASLYHSSAFKELRLVSLIVGAISGLTAFYGSYKARALKQHARLHKDS
jgi:hypothetical protein